MRRHRSRIPLVHPERIRVWVIFPRVRFQNVRKKIVSSLVNGFEERNSRLCSLALSSCIFFPVSLFHFKWWYHFTSYWLQPEEVQYNISPWKFSIWSGICTALSSSGLDCLSPVRDSGVSSCGCSRSSQVDLNFVLAGNLWGAQKKSTVGRLLRRAKDDGEGGLTPSIGLPLPDRRVCRCA